MKKSLVLSMVAFIVAVCVPSDLFAQSSSVVREAERREVQGTQENAGGQNEINAKNRAVPEVVKVPARNWSIGKYEVTQAEYKMIMGENPSHFKGDNLPVENVSWNDAAAFCEKLTEYARQKGLIKNNQLYRLPTSGEWEYACRAGTTTKYCSGDSEKDLSRVAWWEGNSEGKTHPVGTKEPNAWGIYDMHGNVWEWCQDSRGSCRVLRGGGCGNFAFYSESSFVRSNRPDLRDGNFGFRVVLDERNGVVLDEGNAFFPVVKVPDRSWLIGKREVTQAEYKMIMDKNPSCFEGDKLPVENVSWNDAMSFCKKLTEYAKKIGLIENNQFYRLPTSGEWEYACRAGTKTKYCSGDSTEDLSRVAWWEGNSEGKTHPVGTKEPNAWGIYDMHGNVWEWCLDSSKDSRGLPGYVCRGGGYCDPAGFCESSSSFVSQDQRGFRVVLDEKNNHFFSTKEVPGRNWSIGRYEVTQAEYKMIMGKNPSLSKGGSFPVENVSWDDAVVFCKKLTEYAREKRLIEDNEFYRLPTAEEWEYACRAGTTTKYCSGDSEDDLSRVAWWEDNSGNRPHSVGEKKPNAWEIYDMHGNVQEWCQDLRKDSRGSSCRVLCGGGYADPAYDCKSLSSFVSDPGRRTEWQGFRVVLGKKNDFLPVEEVPGRNWSIGKYEVTQAEYERIMDENPSVFKGDNLPVENVSWDDAVAFCKELTKYAKKIGLIEDNQFYRLPTAEEWEYACRAGTTTKYCSGDSEEDLSCVAWWSGNSDNEKHPVGKKKPNAWGIYDMHGNVQEWCQDSSKDSIGLPGHVCRGGGYSSYDRQCKSLFKGSNNSDRSDDLGFRVVLGDFLPVVKVENRNWSIGKYEVTQAEYKMIMGKNPSSNKGDSLPVENVSWNDAVAFCEKLTEYAREKGVIENDQYYRLPTAAEWQYACRAGTTTKYCSGDSEEDLSRVAWWKDNSGNETHPVGEKEPNAWGIYDMHGNVQEWCRDLRGSLCVVCGGACSNAADFCELSFVCYRAAKDRNERLGFRVVLAPTGQ